MSRSLVEGKLPYKWYVGGKFWFKAQEGIYEIAAFQPKTEELYDITFFEIARPFRLARRVDAAKATWEDGQWVFHQVAERRFLPGMEVQTTYADRMNLDLKESPTDFQTLAQYTEEFPYFKLRKMIREIESEGYDSTPYRVEMDRKIAFPALNVITALLGIPFALRLPKTGGLAAAVGISLVIGFLYWVLFAVTVSFGKTGVLPPLVSAWAANLLFLTLGTFLLLRVETQAIT
jgi:lipopolysaccharide export system permease protein